jgi:hypothetical protein
MRVSSILGQNDGISWFVSKIDIIQKVDQKAGVWLRSGWDFI